MNKPFDELWYHHTVLLGVVRRLAGIGRCENDLELRRAVQLLTDTTFDIVRILSYAETKHSTSESAGVRTDG